MRLWNVGASIKLYNATHPLRGPPKCHYWVKSSRLKCFMDCRRELSVAGYFMVAALPPPGIVICVSAGIAALPSFLTVGWSWDDAMTSAP